MARLALSAYRKIPGKGPRLISLGNACVTALGAMPGLPPIGQLAILKSKIKFGTAQREIEKAFTASAARAGLARDEIEELAVPSYGLETVGLRHETFDDYQAELLVDGTTASLHWLKEGKPLKSVPAMVKQNHAEEFKELQASVKDINSILPAQRPHRHALSGAKKLAAGYMEGTLSRSSISRRYRSPAHLVVRPQGTDGRRHVARGPVA